MAAMAIGGPAGVRASWWVWLVGVAVAAGAVMVLAWVTGAFTPAAATPGTCFAYEDVGEAGRDVSVPCDQPHTAQAVAFLKPSLDTAGLREQCRVAVMDWLAEDARTSRARIAYRDILVEVQAPWRKSGVRCDVVRVAFSGVGDNWIPAVLTGSAKGALAAAPETWAQCRRLASSQSAASVGCKSSGKRVVEFPFAAKAKGEYRNDKASKAAEKACRTAAKAEVRKGAKPVLVSEISQADWEAATTAGGHCTYTTKSWKYSGA